MHNDLALSLTHLNPKKYSIVNNFAHLEQQQIRTAQGKEAMASRHMGRIKHTSSTTNPLITSAAESTLSVLSIFLLQTLPSAHATKSIFASVSENNLGID